MLPPLLYFDHNATSPLCRAAREAWLDAVERFEGNPSSPHRIGARAEVALAQARERLAAILDCAPHDIVWTSGATEASNAVLHHAARASAGEAWLSAIEHPCAVESARRHFAGRHGWIPVSRDGIADIGWLAERLEKMRPALVGIMAANNETGALQPWRDALGLCRKRGVPFFCDAAQWIGKLPAHGLGACDFVSGCAHKLGGPQGAGFLKAPAHFTALLVGGPQEEGRRAGTENVAGVLAMVAAIEERERRSVPGAVAEKVAMRDEFIAALSGALPGVEIVGAGAERLWNTVSAIMPERGDCRRRWVVRLDKRGFAVSTGSACASGKEQPSHVLTAMGFSPDAAGRALRFSSGWETRAEDWGALLQALIECADE